MSACMQELHVMNADKSSNNNKCVCTTIANLIQYFVVRLRQKSEYYNHCILDAESFIMLHIPRTMCPK